MVIARDWVGKGIIGSYLMGTEFKFEKKKQFWKWMVTMVALYYECI